MKRLTLFDGQSIKSKELSNWTADEWYTVFGSYFGSDADTPSSLYSVVGWLHACVNLRSDRVSAMPWAIFSGDTKLVSDQDDLTAYPFLDNFTDLLELTESALCLCGYAYWFKTRNLRNKPLGLRWFAPDSIEPLYNSEVGVSGFRRHLNATIGAGSTLYTPEDIIYFKLPNAFSELEPGTPPARAALADAQVLQYMNEFTGSFFARGAIKATILSLAESTPQEEVDRFNAWWKRFFAGVKKSWDTKAVAGPIEAVVVGEGLESLTNSELTAERRQSIATALGVPHSIVAADAANFATAQQDEINFLTNCIIPESRLIERTLNRQMFAPLGLRFRFEPERLSAMQEDEEQRAQSYATYVGANMRPSIAAQLVGLNLPDGVTYEMLDADLQASQELQRQQAEAQIARLNAPPQLAAPQESGYEERQREAEVRRLRRWARGKKEPDVDKFHSHILNRAQKVAALVEIDIVPSILAHKDLWGDSVAEDAPFPYP